MGAMQRTKGRAFEQRVARIIRERYPGAEVWRGDQRSGAREADINTRNCPLDEFWLELTDGRAPNPRNKLEQAGDDLGRLAYGNEPLTPVCVWHRLRERRIWATFIAPVDDVHALVTMEFGDFLDWVDARFARAC